MKLMELTALFWCISGSFYSVRLLLVSDTKKKLLKLGLSFFISVFVAFFNSLTIYENADGIYLYKTFAFLLPFICVLLIFSHKLNYKKLFSAFAFLFMVICVLFVVEIANEQIIGTGFSIIYFAFIYFLLFFESFCNYWLFECAFNQEAKAARYGTKRFVFFVITVFSALMMIFCFFSGRIDNSGWIYVLCGIILTAFLILYLQLFQREIITKRSEENLKQALDTQIKRYEELDQKDSDLRKFRHDYSGLLQNVARLIKESYNEEALKILDEMGIYLNETRMSFSTGNYLLDTILADNRIKFYKIGAFLTFEGFFPTNGIDSIDICTMFNNALNNAFEACEKYGSGAYTSIRSKIIGNRVWVKIENSVTDSVKIQGDGLVSTTKDDKSMHGFGLISIKNAVEKYDGKLNLSVGDGKFCLIFDLKFQNSP